MQVPSAIVPIYSPEPVKNAHQTINSKDDLVCIGIKLQYRGDTNPVRPAPVSKQDQVSRMLYHSNFACNIPLSAAFLHSVLSHGTSAQVSL